MREIMLLGMETEVGLKSRERLAQVLAGNVAWEYLLYLSEYHGITPRLAHNLARDEFKRFVPGPYSERLNRIYQNNIYRNVLLSAELTNVLAAFRQHSIEVITLKGITLAEQLYVNPILRTTTDIDVLVPEAKIPEAASVILEMGYTPSTVPEEVEHPFHRVFYKKGKFPLMLELHWDLYDSKLIKTSRSDIWRRAQLQEFQGYSTNVLSPEDTLIYLAISLFRDNSQPLKYYGDITELLKTHRDTLDWEYIMESAGLLGIKNSIYFSLKCAQELLGAPVPASVITALKPALWRRWLIEIIINNRTLFAPVRWRKLKSENSALVYSLMMSRVRQSLAVLAKYRADGKGAEWLRTIIWIPLVFGTALCLNTGNLFYRFTANLKRTLALNK